MENQLSADQVEIIQEFIQECTDLLDNLEPSIVAFGELTQNSDFSPTEEKMPILHEVFRLFHSIKGSAGFLNFSHMATTAHAAENLLDKIRKGEQAMNGDHVDLLCRTCDFMRATLDQVACQLNDQTMAREADELTGRLKLSLGEPRPASAATETPAGCAEPVTPDTGLLDLAVTPEMLAAFVQEAGEQLQEMEEGLLAWSRDGDSNSLIGELFRKMHSFKGNCGFVGMADLERLSHRIETVLDAARSGTCPARTRPADTLLNLIDTLKGALTDIAGGGKGRIDGLDLYLELLDDLLPADRQGNVSPPAVPRLGEILQEEGLVSAAEVDRALESQKQAATRAETQPAGPGGIAKRQDLRVDVEKIDNLINLIGELVIAENMLVHSPDIEELELENFSKASQQMSKIVKELQEVAMSIRMIPVAGLFNRMTRLVHDLSRKSGKKVNLITGGTETEVDKTVIEKITDPLVHLIRNSMDHGLENPEERRAAGKEEIGTLRLTASHEEGEVLIRIEDDGRGLNRDKILRKAVQKGLLEGDGAGLSDHEVAAMIFLPGFSTAEQVTDVSGRGVGMAVSYTHLTLPRRG